MSDQPERSPSPDDRDRTARLRSLASEAIAQVAEDQTHTSGPLYEAWVERLSDAAQDANPRARDRVIDDMLTSGVTREELIDDFIPAAARALGERWREDQAGFAEVTIGVARLQAILRELSDGRGMLSLKPRVRGPHIGMIVPEEENHTLGALVTTNQLRRDGYSVRLILGQSAAEVAEEIVEYGVEVAFLSASVGTRLESVQSLVDAIRSRTRTRVPIVVGGSILRDHPNVSSITGADLATTDPKEALTQCEQMIQPGGAVPHDLSD